MNNKVRTTPWQLVKSGRYEDAIETYTQLYQAEGRPSHLNNRGISYLNLENYTAALDDFKLAMTITEPQLRADTTYIFQGVCYWYLNQPSQSVQVWRQALTAPYTDSAGGIEPPLLLLYAASRLQDKELSKEAWRLLQKHSRRKIGEWPGPLVPFLLGKIERAELEQKFKSGKSETLIGRWQCQADFYIGLRELREGKSTEFQLAMKRCAESRFGLSASEYYLARWEVRHDFANPVLT